MVGASIFSFGSGSSENDCDDSSESMWWYKAKNMARDFTIGAGYSIDENMSFGMVMSIANKREEELPDSASCKSGRIFGDIMSLIGSGFEIGGGSAEAMGGVVLDSSGAGAVIGIPLNISGVAVAADGVINAERSLTSLANDTMSLISSKSSNGGTGGGSNSETVVNKDGKMLGKNGTKFPSDTKWQNGKTERVDVENPNPGQRPGDVHYHDSKNTKYRFSPNTGKLYDEYGDLASNKIQKVLKNKEVQKAINKGLQMLGEEKYFK
ncbi:hypothetical protein FDG50_12620 [Clostridium botulinum]|uniref:hypothetical protein n=1 Tax=Clostridium botulinum TaxID=1491 RepID=UPI001400F332|nr:hypothetical protein [Clostridium botulinum]MBY6837969.1 hypothetical protein [Clostridium botulinum]NFG63805.1 hypothetical protein [Clostridium botulinum]NFQ24952.1 hypothetical protein [Clostridium botulinum]